MTKTKFTPGPWKLMWRGNEKYPYPFSINTADNRKWITRDGTVSSKANAHLIAAAPDLYAVLEALATEVESIARNSFALSRETFEQAFKLMYPEGFALWSEARKTLAKARGGS